MIFRSLNFTRLNLPAFIFLNALTCLIFAPMPILSQSGIGGNGVGQYDLMKPKPRQLFDKWAAVQNSLEGKSVPPVERFNNLPISRRSTYAALMNALNFSKMTDPATGKLYGFAIDLIDEIETIAGQESGRRSDEQFRLYVKLKDGAVKKLDLCPEFVHDKDNTIFHKGYPTNYRQSGNAPTLQFSITPDGKRADIDVDYRSSGFPAALFNGHLSAGNSDVRASGNYPTHLKRWVGLINWWDNNFPALAVLKNKNITPSDPNLRVNESSSNADLTVAISAFFNSWLLERNTERATAYLQPNLTFCSDLEDSPARQMLDARYKELFLTMLKSANKELGKPKKLDQVIRAVPAIDPLIPAVENNPQRDLFTLAIITDGDYDHFTCAAKKAAQQKSRHLENYGKHYVVKFRFALENGNGGILRLMWSKETGSWKIESFDAVTA